MAIGVLALVAALIALRPLHIGPLPAASASNIASTASAGASSSPAPELEFEPIGLAGDGDRRVTFEIPQGAAAIARMEHPGSGAFHVETVPSGTEAAQVLVDVPGRYTGTVLFDALVGQHSTAFDIRAGGSWTITIEPVGLATSWSGVVPLAGSGDDVVLLDATADGTTAVRVTHAGSGAIRVLAYTESGDLDQLVQTTGPADETHEVPAGTVCLEVRAGGPWAISPG